MKRNVRNSQFVYLPNDPKQRTLQEPVIERIMEYLFDKKERKS